MKRSDMVKYMTQEYASSHRGGMSEMSDEERMDYLLKKLEEVGMEPPVIKNPKYDIQVAMSYAQHPFLEYDVPSDINAWEQE